MIRRANAALMLTWLLLAAAAAVAAPVIENGATPANGLRTIELQEQWRIGGLDDEENLLGLVREAAMDEEGNVYLLDTQLVTVLVYDADGQFVAELGRDGDGPGEFRRPRDLILLPDGTVGVVQGFPGSIVKITRDGMPAGRIELAGDPTEGGFFALRKVLANGEGLVFAGSHITREETKRTSLTQIVRSDLEGKPGRDLLRVQLCPRFHEQPTGRDDGLLSSHLGRGARTDRFGCRRCATPTASTCMTGTERWCAPSSATMNRGSARPTSWR